MATTKPVIAARFRDVPKSCDVSDAQPGPDGQAKESRIDETLKGATILRCREINANARAEREGEIGDRFAAAPQIERVGGAKIGEGLKGDPGQRPGGDESVARHGIPATSRVEAPVSDALKAWLPPA